MGRDLHGGGAMEVKLMRTLALIVKLPSDPARADALHAAVTAVRAAGHRVRVRVTFEAGDARRYARGAALRGCDVVVAAGGDGTVNEVVNGLAAAGGDTALAVVPLGTANDFARGLGLPLDPLSALRLAADGATTELDVAEVNRRCFINVSTGGFGAEATHGASRSVKRWLGPLAYVARGARMLAHYEPLRAVFRADGETVHDGRFVFFAVGNARRTGGGTRVTPRADPGDGKLDILVVGDVSRFDFLTLLPDLRAGTHLESPDVVYLRAHRFEVIGAAALRVNADGEPVFGRRFRYDVRERGLPVIMP
jgi:diacylglycerol kinase (ATP)